jgi:hypothetical protein
LHSIRNQCQSPERSGGFADVLPEYMAPHLPMTMTILWERLIQGNTKYWLNRMAGSIFRGHAFITYHSPQWLKHTVMAFLRASVIESWIQAARAS